MRLRNIIPYSAKPQLYKSAILPDLTYCDIVWHLCKTADGRELERSQEQALTAVFKSKVDTYSALLNRPFLSTLYERRLQSIATLIFKVKNGLMPLYITEIFQSTYKGYELRNADFNIPRVRTSRYGKHSLRYFGPYLWRKLSVSDREKTSLNDFIQSIKKRNLTELFENTCVDCEICS